MAFHNRWFAGHLTQKIQADTAGSLLRQQETLQPCGPMLWLDADMGTTAHVLMITFRIWLIEIPVAAFNAFVLMDHVYMRRARPLRAMGTRIVYPFVFAYFSCTSRTITRPSASSTRACSGWA